MVTRLNALSVSRSVQTGPLLESGPVWRVLAVFERACDLATPGGDVVALVTPEIGDGALNIVVERLDQSLRLVQSGMVATLQDTQLQIGSLEIKLDQALVWEPRPNWERLHQNRARIESRLSLVRDLALRQAPADSLLALFRSGWITNPARQASDFQSDASTAEIMLTTAQRAAESLRAGWSSGWAADKRIEAGARRLAGLGGGLTPAGDDFLMGVMLRAWLDHPDPEPFCQQLVAVAAPRTTTLSAAMLRAAARGECSAAWHALLAALQSEMESTLVQAVEGVLAHGHTSGADTLAGFLWTPTFGSPKRCSHQSRREICSQRSQHLSVHQRSRSCNAK